EPPRPRARGGGAAAGFARTSPFRASDGSSGERGVDPARRLITALGRRGDVNENTSTKVEVEAELPAAAEPTLRQQVVSGVGWKIVTVAVVQVTRIVVGVILARLLVPRDFGLASMALLFVGVASVFTDLSMG